MSSDKNATGSGPDDENKISSDNYVEPLVRGTNVVQETSLGNHTPRLEQGIAETDDGEQEAESRQDLSSPQAAPELPSTPEDTISLQDSILSSPHRPQLGSPGRLYRPFERRFSARLSPSPLATPRPASPAFLTGRSRQHSMLSAVFSVRDSNAEQPETPWEVFRWVKLRKLSGEAFSELAKRNYGRPTCMAVASLIALGTSKGLILIFDYNQNLKATIGLGTKAVESGAVTAIALSADYSVVAGGHANGYIFTWDIQRSSKPFLAIPSLSINTIQNSQAEGHIVDTSVLHISFLGTRHTALVSADITGMAFSHLATRGLGAIARTVKTARILGRYPETTPITTKPRRPSSVLACSSLPLGNFEHAIDVLGLVALLTPYLLVIVSTTPVAQTQHKAGRPKEIMSVHGALTGALAWYPAMKSKSESSNAKLAYCWLNVVTIIEVVEILNETEKEAPPDLGFKELNRWQNEESVVAMQWLNRNVLAILTISQQLIILEDGSLAATDQSDLIKRHVFHADLFSRQLGQMIENSEQDDTTMHGVIADAFYMSFKAYKGRLFLLGFNDVSIGTLSNWADRLLALIQQGDFIAAIQLATSYHIGVPEQAAVGLPSEETARHDLVKEKLLEMMTASLKYAFGKNPDAENRVSDIQLQHLAQACFTACFQVHDLDFLYEEVYSWYSENDARHIFLDILETYIFGDNVTMIPPVVLKDLVSAFVEKGQSSRLEEILCLLDPATMDLEQVTILCRKFKLYDALFYIWSQAIGDYTTVLKNLLVQGQHADDSDGSNDSNDEISSKVFPYLSYTLTGRIYPTGQALPDSASFRARAEVYQFLFSGMQEQSYVHLRQALHLDAPSFLSMLNEAYEDDFLDGNTEERQDLDELDEAGRFSLSLTRQYIIRVLLEVMVQPEFSLESTIYLDMFVARNQAKYPQFIRIPGSVLQKVMVNLCQYPSEEVAEDCQLSLEYLLSVYQPPDVFSLLPALEEARFYRVIKSIYRSEKQYAKLLQTCFKDTENPDGIFECIQDYLGPGSLLNDRQTQEFRSILVANGQALIDADLRQAATTIDRYAADIHPTFIDMLDSDGKRLYEYLRQILEVEHAGKEDTSSLHDAFLEKYIRLLCEHDPHHVSAFIDNTNTSNLHLDQILPALENSGVIDAAVVLIAKDGQVRQAMDRLTKHLGYLEVALTSLAAGPAIGPDIDNAIENANDLVESIEKYSKVGIWLCSIQSTEQETQQKRPKINGTRYSSMDVLNKPLSSQERLWLDLLDAVVRIVKYDSQDGALSRKVSYKDITSQSAGTAPITQRLRITVQNVFTALLTATSDSSKYQNHEKLSFLRIFQAFLSRASESLPSLAHLRDVLRLIFSAYAYEESLLVLSQRLLQKDLFVQVKEVAEHRKRGWRPASQTCNGCGQRVWGPGIGNDAWNAWLNRKEGKAETQHSDKQPQADPKGKGKEKSSSNGNTEAFAVVEEAKNTDTSGVKTTTDPMQGNPNDKEEEEKSKHQALVVFSCRHIWHQDCLRTSGGMVAKHSGSGSADMVCPLDGVS